MKAIARNLMGLSLIAAIFVIAPNTRVDSSTLRILAEKEAPSESCHLREIELCSMGLLSIFQNPNGLPMKELEMKRQCEYFNESVQCLDRYSQNCLTGDQFGLADMFLRAPRRVIEDFCRPDSELRVNYTKHIECFREVQRKYQKSCLTDYQVGFEAIHKIDGPLRLKTACCNTNRLKECFFGPIDYECGIAASETVERLMVSISGSFFTLPCRTYDAENEDCKKLLPKIGTKPHTGRNISAFSRVVSGFTNVPASV